MCGSLHQRLFEENFRKTKRGLRIWKRRVRELFTHREGISNLHARHEELHPLIECAIKNNVTTKLIIFPRVVNFFSFTILFLFI